MDEKHSINRHIPVLDGLRGLAVISVIMFHVNCNYGGPFTLGRVGGPMSSVFGWGWVGVDLFFVLSGFLITGILFDAKGSDGYFRNFYGRRTLRIFPLYYGFLFLIVVLSRLDCPICPWVAFNDAVTLGTYTYNVRAAVTGVQLRGLEHLWSLGVEEHFYLCWPIVVWAMQRRSLMRFCLIVAAASFWLRVMLVLSGAWPGSPYILTPCRLDSLLAGAYAALARRNRDDWVRLQQLAGNLVLGTGCLLLGLALGQRHFIHFQILRSGQPAVNPAVVWTIGITALAIFFSGLLVLAVDAAEGSRLGGLLKINALRTIGRYSYAMYIFHPLILDATVRFIPALSRAGAVIAKPVALTLVLAASFVASWLSYHLYEKHFLRLKRFFEYRAPARSAMPVSSQYPS